MKQFFKNFWKLINKEEVLTPVEQAAIDIFKICLNDENNIRYLNSPNSDKKYIVSKTYITDKVINTFIILHFRHNKVTIVNHQYAYDISLPTKACEQLNDLFNDKVEEDREDMEKEILSNITQSLDIVLNQVKDRIEPTVKPRINKKPKVNIV